MWLQLLDFLYSPLVLLYFSYNFLTDPRWFSGNKNATSPCLSGNETSGVPLFYFDHPNPKIRGCYASKSIGPCAENMKIYQIEDTQYGQCNCDELSLRVLLYHNETNQCYPIFQQGYCALGEQLVITRENPSIPVCQRTVCYEELKKPENKGKDLVPFSNNTVCVAVGSQCNPPYGNGVGTIGFARDNVIKVTPSCVKPPNPRARAISVPPIRCAPGTYRAISGHCQPPIFFFDD